MAMKVITLFNEKGGVGKTTWAKHIAAGLAIKGHKVALIDTDAQGHSTIGFGLAKSAGFYDLVVRGAGWNDVLLEVPKERYALPDNADSVTGSLYVLPSNIETRSISQNISDAFIVLKRLLELRNAVDYAIIDTSPTPSLLHASIYMATDSVVYPTQLEAWAFDGLAESMAHRKQFTAIRQQYNLPEIEVLGIIPNMARMNTLEHSENYAALKQRFGAVVWKPVPLRTLWAETSSMKRSVFAIAPGSKTESDAWRIVNRIEAATHEPA